MFLGLLYNFDLFKELVKWIWTKRNVRIVYTGNSILFSWNGLLYLVFSKIAMRTGNKWGGMEAPVFVLWENQWWPAVSCNIHPANKLKYREIMENYKCPFHGYCKEAVQQINKPSVVFTETKLWISEHQVKSVHNHNAFWNVDLMYLLYLNNHNTRNIVRTTEGEKNRTLCFSTHRRRRKQHVLGQDRSTGLQRTCCIFLLTQHSVWTRNIISLTVSLSRFIRLYKIMLGKLNINLIKMCGSFNYISH